MEQRRLFPAGFSRVSSLALLEAALHPDNIIDSEDERDLPQGSDTHRPAAVLIAITNRTEPGVILTQRTPWLRSHAGQVAFPGGKIDLDDADEIAAALREAEEELALPRDQVRIIGKADVYYSGSGYRITPVIGIIPPDLDLVPNPGEVEDYFEVPLSFLLDPTNLAKRVGIWQGQERHYYDMQWQGRRIWGVTAGIIANLARRLV
jgi:8-oxo-dGTP pyrophosphatase MutT (NUDIX family)